MTKDELIEAMALAVHETMVAQAVFEYLDNPFDATAIAAVALTAIEAQGLAIVPVKITQAQLDACAKIAWASPDIYDAMIQAGRITQPATSAVNIPETFY